MNFYQITILLILGLLIFGCTNITNNTITDCGKDWNCFYNKLTYCEPAKISITEKINLGEKLLNWNLPETNYFSVINSTAQITGEFSKTTGISGGQCKTYFSSIQINESSPLGNSIVMFQTCKPNQEEKCGFLPIVSSVNETR